MAELDFQAMLDGFTGGSSANPIESIYKIIPCYDNYQMKLLMAIKYYAAKWELEDVSDLLSKIDVLLGKNRNLGFMSSRNLQNLLAAYTQNEMIRGVKVNAFSNTGEAPGGGR